MDDPGARRSMPTDIDWRGFFFDPDAVRSCGIPGDDDTSSDHATNSWVIAFNSAVHDRHADPRPQVFTPRPNRVYPRQGFEERHGTQGIRFKL